MTADDELQQAFATLTDHLHEDIGRQIAQVTAELTAAAREERERAAADAAAEAERHADAQLAAALKDAEERRAAAENRAREEGRQIGIEEGRFEGYEQGKADASAEAARRVEERAAADAAADQEQAEAATHAGDAAASDRLADAIRALDRARSLSEILDTLASCAAREADRAAVLVAAADRFRGWRFIGFDPSFDDAKRIDLSSEQSGVVGEAARSGLPARVGEGIQPPSFAASVECESTAIPLVLSGQTVAVLYGEFEKEKGKRQKAEGILEIIARHAARCLEAVTAFNTIRLLTERSGVAAGLGSAPATNGNERAEENAAALRYARLLVSEIRMYHEPEIVAGRRERDLATRLGGEIARARTLYEERVPAHVRQRGDLFHDELVRTLAEGDSALLAEVRTEN
ncbi:MAG TPA: hypothetical protein VGJ29_06620 [Vicinamibacterales bacterium]